MTLENINKAATFQRVQEMVLTKCNWQTCLVFMHELMMHSKFVEKHIRHADYIINTPFELLATLNDHVYLLELQGGIWHTHYQFRKTGSLQRTNSFVRQIKQTNETL